MVIKGKPCHIARYCEKINNLLRKVVRLWPN
nr:MAG TPA: hypothetical protein [Caudoviricetes sp.]